MSTRNIFAVSALAAVIATGVFGICALQHAIARDAMSESGLVVVNGSRQETCPMSTAADFRSLEKFSQADPMVFGKNFSPAGFENSVNLNVLQISSDDSSSTAGKHLYLSKFKITLSITSPPLMWALSRGILHPKKDAVA